MMLRLTLIWLAQTARALADWILRVVALLALVGAGDTGLAPVYHLALAAFAVPFVLLAPFSGTVANSLPRRWVMSVSALFCLLAVAGFLVVGGNWLLAVFVVGVGGAANSVATYAALPAASRDTGLSLPRITGLFELGLAVAVAGGIVAGLGLPDETWRTNGSQLAIRAAAVLVGLNVLCLLGSLPAAFPSDTLRPESPAAGFFRDMARILTARAALWPLIGLAGFQTLVLAGAAAVVGESVLNGREGLLRTVPAVLCLGAGAAAGAALGAFTDHPRRCLGLVPLAATVLVAALFWAGLAAEPGVAGPLFPCLLIGLAGGTLAVPLRSAYLAALPAGARGNGASAMSAATTLLPILFAGLMVPLVRKGILPTPRDQLLLYAWLAVPAAGAAWFALAIPLVELCLALLLTPFFRVRVHGPGLGGIPLTGPLIVVANHSSYFDPFWLGKVFPRNLRPMMTSLFFDRPGIRWLMRHVVGAIRVQASNYRREAPELDEAVRVLSEGGAVLIFPEAILRRKEEKLLRRFGQGIWHILQRLPDTPVLVVWVEGGWGSWASYKDGPPFKNKPVDFLRPIGVGIGPAAPLPPDVLADQRLTREYLMRKCLECRHFLGLEVPSGLTEVEGEEENPRNEPCE